MTIPTSEFSLLSFLRRTTDNVGNELFLPSFFLFFSISFVFGLCSYIHELYVYIYVPYFYLLFSTYRTWKLAKNASSFAVFIREKSYAPLSTLALFFIDYTLIGTRQLNWHTFLKYRFVFVLKCICYKCKLGFSCKFCIIRQESLIKKCKLHWTSGLGRR